MPTAIFIIFCIVYLGMILGGLPFLQLDRTGIALLGAIAEHGLAADDDDLALAGDAPCCADQMLKLGTLHTRAAARRV